MIRDPADWAREWGWVSPVRARRAALRLHSLAQAIDGALNADEDEGARMWCDELEALVKYLDPDPVIAKTKQGERQ